MWLDRLAVKYGMPRAALVRLLDRPGAVEYEIATLVVEAAERKAAALLADRQWPSRDTDLWSRAVRGCYQRLRDAETAASAGRVAQLIADLR